MGGSHQGSANGHKQMVLFFIFLQKLVSSQLSLPVTLEHGCSKTTKYLQLYRNKPVFAFKMSQASR